MEGMFGVALALAKGHSWGGGGGDVWYSTSPSQRSQRRGMFGIALA